MATIEKFEDMTAWQKARELNKEINTALKDSKDFGFRDQLFRASVSIMNNMAEGFERNTDKEFHQFLNYAKGSAGETRSMLYLAADFGYLTNGQSKELRQNCTEVAKMLSAFMKHLNGSKP